MPDEETINRAREDEREGKSPSTQVGSLFARKSIIFEKANMERALQNKPWLLGSLKRVAPA
jgi:hypothetical protein